jgi:uncharacterized repeat protein (TIGR02543 family)
MRSVVTLGFAIVMLLFVLCGVVQDNPLDEDGSGFIQPIIGIDTAGSSIKMNDTIHVDSATLVLVGNRPESRFQIKVDSLPWSNWKPAGSFDLQSLSDGQHMVYINTMYQDGIKTFKDSIVFFVQMKNHPPVFPSLSDTAIAVDTGAAVTFSAIAAGLEPITYQWTKGASIVSGMTGATFTLASFSMSDIGVYRCIAANRDGSDTSRGFSLQFIFVKGGIKGIVVSSKTSVAISGAIVTLSLGNVKCISNSSGLFEFDYLVPGTYSIAIAMTGYRQYTKDAIAVSDSVVSDVGVIALTPNDTEIINLKVNYDGNGNTGGFAPVDQNNYTEGTIVTVRGNNGNLVKTGFVFNGWNSSADGSAAGYLPGDTYTMGASNITLFAKWKPLPTLTITYDNNGKTGGLAPVDSNKYAPGDSLVVLGNPGELVKNGYSFAGWNTKADGTGTNYNTGTKFVMPSNSVTFFAKWTTKPTSLVIYLAGRADTGSVPTQGNYEVGALVTVSDNIGKLGKTGCAFSGWNTLPSGTGTSYLSGASFSKGSVNDTLYPQWNCYSYTVTFNDQSATTPVNPTSQIVIAPATTVASLPSAPVKKGYIFGGWYTAINGGGVQFTTSTAVAGNSTVYAKWNSYSYTVTFDDQNAITPVYPKTKTVASPATTVGTLPTPPGKPGYSFGGWYPAINGGGTEFTASTVVTENITMYAKWNTYAYNVAFYDQGATTPVTPTSKTVISPATTIGSLPSQPSKTGYIFGGWWYNAPPNGVWSVFNANTEVTASISVYAQWNNYSYTVTYNDQGATTPANPATKSVASPKTTVESLPTPPIKPGYVFGGWYTAISGGGAQFFANTVVTGNITVYAKWNSYSYTVTYNDQGATTPASQTTKSVASPKTTVEALPTPPIKSGYVFGGWFTAINGSGSQLLATTAVTGDITVYAYWKAVYTITYDDQSATTPVGQATQTVIAPATSVGALPAEPMKTGFVFGGWFTAINGNGTQFLSNTAVTASDTVFAYWKTSYTVTYDNQGATTPQIPPSQTVIAPATSVGTLPIDPKKTGYIFGGWFTEIGGETQFIATTTVTASDTVYAKWNSYSYTVKYDDQGATTPVTPDSQIVASPSTTVGAFPPEPAKTGFIFDGWYTAMSGGGTRFNPNTTVIATITVYAKWTISP